MQVSTRIIMNEINDSGSCVRQSIREWVSNEYKIPKIKYWMNREIQIRKSMKLICK